MIRKRNKLFYWLPRVLAVIFTTLVALFALDAFGQGYGFLGTLWALFLHLMPAVILFVVTKIAWRLEIYGGFLFILLGLIFTILTWGKMDVLTFLFLPGLALLIGFLFWLSRALNKEKDELIII